MTDASPVPGDERPRLEVARRHGIAAAVAVCYLALAIILLPSYGPVWDPVLGELPHGERLLNYWETRDVGYLDVAATEPPPLVRHPHPEFAVGGFGFHQVVAPLSAFLSAVCCRVFWTELGWLPATSAHHLVGPIFVALLGYALIVVLGRRFGLLTGIAAFLCLVTAPRYFAHAFNNIKDVPQSCCYTIAMFAWFCALRSGRLRTWMLAGIATAFALAAKVNGIFVPFHAAALWLGSALIPSLRRARSLWPRPAGIGVAIVAFLVAYYAISPDLWREPIAATRARFGEVFGVGNQMVREGHGLSLGEIWNSISWQKVEHVLWTTPPMVLIFAAIGVFAPRLRAEERIFVLLGFGFPIARTLMPGMANFDGVRHILEFLPMLCVAAGIGLGFAARSAASLGAVTPRRWVQLGLLALALAPATVATVTTHPNGICYFNVFVGGLSGAQAKRIQDSTDYWGNSYWQGIDYLNAHADRDARVLVTVAPFLVAAAAPVKLRADLRLHPAAPTPFDAPIFVMFVTREGGYDGFTHVVMRTLTPVHQIRVQGGTILEIYRLEPGVVADEAAYAVWRQRYERSVDAAVARLATWLHDKPERVQEIGMLLGALRSAERPLAEARLREILPAEFDDCLDDIFWFYGTK